MNYIDLFAGGGGFALGAYWAGFRCENHFFSEIEDYPIKIYQKRFPEAIPFGDIRNIDCQELIRNYGTDWVLTGGSPCQDISNAGKRAGIHGEKSGLWFEYWRLIRELRPRVAVVENVSALSFRGLNVIMGCLAEIGYDAEWKIISASSVGAIHGRNRMWIVAYPNQRMSDGNENKYSVNVEGIKKRWSEETASLLCFCRDDFQTDRRSLRDDDGFPEALEQVGMYGNAIVPQIAELIFRQLIANGFLEG